MKGRKERTKCPICGTTRPDVQQHVSVGPIISMDDPLNILDEVEIGYISHYYECPECSIMYQSPYFITSKSNRLVDKIVDKHRFIQIQESEQDHHREFLTEMLGKDLLYPYAQKGLSSAPLLEKDPSSYSRFSPTEGTYNLTILSNFLSAVVDPVASLNQVRDESITHDGYIYITELLPNASDFAFNLAAKAVFNSKSMIYLLRLCHLDIVGICTSVENLGILCKKEALN